MAFKMMELGPLEYAILGNIFLLILLFIILVYTFVRLRKVSKEKARHQKLHKEYIAEPPQNYSTLCGLTSQERKCFSQTLPHPAKKSVRIDERREPLWIAVPHPSFYPAGQFATLNIPVKKPSQRTHSCRAYGQSQTAIKGMANSNHTPKQLNLADFYGKY